MLEYTLTVDDLAAFAAWQARQSGEEARRLPRMRLTGAWIAGGVAYLVAFAILPLPLLLGGQLPLAGLAELLAIVVGGIAGWVEWGRGGFARLLLARPYRSRARAALRRTGGERRVWLDESGLNVAAGERRDQVPWTAITGTAETDRHAFVLTGENSAHILPRRVDAAEVAELVSAIQQRIASR